MATIKSYTDISQSKKLTEILPLESADMEYLAIKENGALVGNVPFVKDDSKVDDSAYNQIYDRIACWSLSALISVLPKIHKLKPILDLEENSIQYSGIDLYVVADNPVDACYAMIIKLNEQNLL